MPILKAIACRSSSLSAIMCYMDMRPELAHAPAVDIIDIDVTSQAQVRDRLNH